MKQYFELLGWIHFVANIQCFTEFGQAQVFGNYILLKPLVDSKLPPDISDICKNVQNQNSTDCTHYKVEVQILHSLCVYHLTVALLLETSVPKG